MSHLLKNNNLSIIQKICLAGLFIALATICQKVLAINYIPIIPFLRISFGGCACIIFASILLGPWFGLLVGAASDILGYFVFDIKSFGFFPTITCIYALLGLLAFFVFRLFKRIKNRKVCFYFEIGFMVALLIGISLFFALNNEITLYSTTYEITTAIRIIVPVFMIILFTAITLFTLLFAKKKNDDTVYLTSFSCFVLDLVVLVAFGSVMKAVAFGWGTYLMILVSQLIVSFFNIALNTVLITFFSSVASKRLKTNII